jgi:hypothetical protein
MSAVVTSITGLQKLSNNLVYFNADYNGFNTLNLSGLSNLVDVDVSDCNIPGSGTNSLTSINLSGCTLLQELRIDDSNLFNGININHLTNLYWLDVDQSNLPSLNLSGLSNLYYVDAWGNEDMSVVNISGCSSLVDLALDTCNLSSQTIDHITSTLDALGNTGGYLTIDGGTNAVPSVSAMGHITNLQAKSWSVYYNS